MPHQPLKVLLPVFLLLTAASPTTAFQEVSTVKIGGAQYFAAEGFAQSKGFRTEWDDLLKNVTIRGAQGPVKFHVGSEYILSRGQALKLKNKVLYSQGSVMVPEAAMVYLEEPAASRREIEARRMPQPIVPHPLRRIVLDPGHGGRDLGATSRSGVFEKDLVLELTRMVRDELQGRGLDVILTRSRDVFIPLSERARLANAKGADFFVSIHANASRTSSLQGFEVYHLSEDAEGGMVTAQRDSSVTAARHIADTVEGSVAIAARRVKPANFYVLRWTACPAVLVETGYLSNGEDEVRLLRPAYQRQLASAIAGGILAFKEEFERTDGFRR